MCFLLGRVKKIPLDMQNTNNFKVLLFRNSIMVTQGLVFAQVQFYLPLPIAATLNSTSPIWIYIIDYYSYGI
jgi:hypothetical protein